MPCVIYVVTEGGGLVIIHSSEADRCLCFVFLQ